MQKILTVIIPTYNMEKYIAKCIESLLIPSIDLVDIIVVNDGSKDRSSEIAHSYAMKFPASIRVIDKENGNYGSCINAALPLVKGKYIKILDADDWFDTNIFELYIQTLETVDVDLIINDVAKVNELNIKSETFHFALSPKKITDFNEIIDQINIALTMHALCCYNKRLFEGLDYRQSEGISYTDVEWIFLPMSKVNSVFYFDYTLYRYLIGREGQTMESEQIIRNIHHQIAILEKHLSDYKKIKQNNRIPKANESYLKSRILRRAISIYQTALYIHFPLIKPDYLNQVDSLLIQDKTLFEETENFKISRLGFKPIKYWRRFKHLKFLRLLPFYIFKMKQKS